MKNHIIAFAVAGVLLTACVPSSLADTVNLDFNSDTFDPLFHVYINNVGLSTTNWAWGASAGEGTPANGGVRVVNQADATASFFPVTFGLSSMATTLSLDFKTTTTPGGSGDKPLQLGFLSGQNMGFNNNAGFSFMSFRIFGNGGVEFQSKTGSGSTASLAVAGAGAVTFNDWLRTSLTLTSVDPAAGKYNFSVGVWDIGPDGTASPTVLVDPATHTGSVTVPDFAAGTAGGQGAIAGWRSTMGTPNFDNFLVSNAVPEPSTLALGILGLGGLMLRRRRS